MGERIVAYRTRIDALLADEEVQVDWDLVLEEHLVQVGFFQHERLVHLLVTLAFALMELGCTVVVMLAPQLPAVALMLLLLVLLVPYIFHYYRLENETQKLYVQYDQILHRAKRQGRCGGAQLTRNEASRGA